MEVITELWQTLTADYPSAGVAVAVLLGSLLLVWGVRSSAY